MTMHDKINWNEVESMRFHLISRSSILFICLLFIYKYNVFSMYLSLLFILIQQTFRCSYTLIITSRYKTNSEQFLFFFLVFLISQKASRMACTNRKIFGNVEYLRLFPDIFVMPYYSVTLWLNSESLCLSHGWLSLRMCITMSFDKIQAFE